MQNIRIKRQASNFGLCVTYIHWYDYSVVVCIWIKVFWLLRYQKSIFMGLLTLNDAKFGTYKIFMLFFNILALEECVIK